MPGSSLRLPSPAAGDLRLCQRDGPITFAYRLILTTVSLLACYARARNEVDPLVRYSR